MDSEKTARELAIKRLKSKRDFSTHMAIYVVVNVFLWILWAVTDDSKNGVPWPVWITLGWGIGVALNAWEVFGRRPITEAEVEREMERTRGLIPPDDEST